MTSCWPGEGRLLMTVIAAYGDIGFGFLFADTLITTKKPTLSKKTSLAISGREISGMEPLDAAGKVFLYNYYQKITIVSEHLAVAYAGDVDLAQKIVQEIKDRLSDYKGQYKNGAATLANILGPHESLLGTKVAIVATMICIEGDKWWPATMGTGLQECNIEVNIFPRPLFITGTGADVMRRNMLTVSGESTGTLDGSPLAEAGPLPLFRSLSAIGLQHFRELTGDVGLDLAFGGPFELVHTHHRPDGTPYLDYLSEVSFSYWSIESDGKNGLRWGLIQPILYQKYIYGAIISASEHVVQDEFDLTTRTSTVKRSKFVLSPIVMASSSKHLNEIRDFVRNPHFSPTTHVLFFFDQTYPGRVHSMVLPDNEFFSVSRSPQGFRMTMKEELLSPFNEWYDTLAKAGAE